MANKIAVGFDKVVKSGVYCKASLMTCSGMECVDVKRASGPQGDVKSKIF